MTSENAPNNTAGKEVQTYRPQWTEDELASLRSWEDIGAEADATVDVTDFGTGFTVLSDKGRLVGVPLVILDWRFSMGDYSEMVSVLLMTKAGEKWVINDGGTGICEQMRRVDAKVDRSKRTVIRCPKGLTASSYTYRDASGKDIPATTYYLSMEAIQ